MRRRCGGKKVYYQNEFDRQTNHTVQYALFVPKRLFWGHFNHGEETEWCRRVFMFIGWSIKSLNALWEGVDWNAIDWLIELVRQSSGRVSNHMMKQLYGRGGWGYVWCQIPEGHLDKPSVIETAVSITTWIWNMILLECVSNGIVVRCLLWEMSLCIVVDDWMQWNRGNEDDYWREYHHMLLMNDSRAAASNDDEKGEWVLEDWT